MTSSASRSESLGKIDEYISIQTSCERENTVKSRKLNLQLDWLHWAVEHLMKSYTCCRHLEQVTFVTSQMKIGGTYNYASRLLLCNYKNLYYIPFFDSGIIYQKHYCLFCTTSATVFE